MRPRLGASNEGLSSFGSPQRMGSGDPSLRASDEHLPSVCVPRADSLRWSFRTCSCSISRRGRRAGSNCARPTRGVFDRALRDLRETNEPPSPRFSPRLTRRVGWRVLDWARPTRAFSGRALRDQEDPSAHPLPYFHPSPLIPPPMPPKFPPNPPCPLPQYWPFRMRP